RWESDSEFSAPDECVQSLPGTVSTMTPRIQPSLNSPFDRTGVCDGLLTRMSAEEIIAEIEWLERVFSVPDTKPLGASDLLAANRRHDETLAHSPWFKLWQSYGICCRPASHEHRLGVVED